MLLPPLTAPPISQPGRCSRLVRCDSVTTAMLDFGWKSNGLWRCLDFFLAVSSLQRVVRYSRKLHLDFGVIHRIGNAMDEQELRGLFTEIGCAMEDASVTALVWKRDDTRSIMDRASELRNAYDKIGLLLESIEANVR